MRAACRALLLLALAWIVAVLGVFASALMESGWTERTNTEMLLTSAAITPLVAAGACVLRTLVTALAGPRSSSSSAACGKTSARGVVSRISRALRTHRGVSIACLAFVIFLFWLPRIVAFYPSCMNYDTFYQISQTYPKDGPVHVDVWTVPGAVTDAQFSDHHPLFDTLLYGAFAQASDVLFGTWNVGVFAFAVLQAAGTALAFSYAIHYFRSIGAPRPFCLGVAVFICVVPVYGMYASTMLKDMLFSGLFVVWFCLVAEVVRTRGETLVTSRRIAVLVVLCVLLSLTKKTGVYIVVPTMVLLAAVYRRVWWKLLMGAVSSGAIMWVLLPVVVFPALDVIPGGSQEVLGTPFQQTARYVAVHGDELDDEEYQAIDAVLRMDDLASRYVPKWADPVKYVYRQETSREELVAYAKVWVREGLRHPMTYVQATLALTTGFFGPGGTIACGTETWDVEHGGTEMLSQPASLAGARAAYLEAYNAFASAPVVGVTLWSVLYVLWIPVLALWWCLDAHRRWLPLFVPILLAIASILVSPMYDPRYATMLIYISPLLVLLLGAWVAHSDRRLVTSVTSGYRGRHMADAPNVVGGKNTKM